MKKDRIKEVYERYVGGMAPWQIKLAIARLRYFHVPQDAWDDTMQELAIVVYEFQFDPAKAHAASKRTLLCRAIDNRIRMLARSNARHLAMLDRVGQLAQNTEDPHRPEDCAMAADVRRVMGELSSIQQDICRALMDGQSVYEIARSTDRHYETIRRHVRKIREMFTERGMDV